MSGQGGDLLDAAPQRLSTWPASPVISSAERPSVPTAAQLAGAPLEEAGIIASRASTIRAVARAACDGTLTFDGVSTLAVLRGIRGIGEWTAEYVAMRALNEPDAFPSGDLVLRRIAGGLSARELDGRAERWRPWRSYAVMLLWQSAGDSPQLTAQSTVSY